MNLREAFHGALIMVGAIATEATIGFVTLLLTVWAIQDLGGGIGAILAIIFVAAGLVGFFTVLFAIVDRYLG